MSSMRLGGTPNWGFRPMTLPAPQRFEQADCSGGGDIQRFGGAGHRDAQLQVGRSQHGGRTPRPSLPKTQASESLSRAE
jgi:hypothetical protein